MDKSNIIFRTWNDKHASADLILLNALQVTEGQKSTLNEIPPSTVQTPIPQSPLSQPNPLQSTPASDSDLLPAIKDWAGYSSHPVSDAQFLSKIGISGQSIPHWMAKAAKYTVDGDITSQELANVLKYLASHGVIK
jgi:hypothetical protein